MNRDAVVLIGIVVVGLGIAVPLLVFPEEIVNQPSGDNTVASQGDNNDTGNGNANGGEDNVTGGDNLLGENTGNEPVEVNRVAVIETNLGTMEFELYEQRAPITTGNFISLAENGFYDGLIFHRVVPGFVIQGGDPNGDGTGGPGYSIPDEFHPELRHDSKGVLSMANSGPNTGGSQFFITLDATPLLDDVHAVFGKLITGENVLDAIAAVETDANDKPLEDVVMTSVTIRDGA